MLYFGILFDVYLCIYRGDGVADYSCVRRLVFFLSVITSLNICYSAPFKLTTTFIFYLWKYHFYPAL